MTYQGLYDRLRAGETIFVKFTNTKSEIFGCDDGPDDGMIARLIGICKVPNEPTLLRIMFDFSGFEEENKVVADRDWFDSDGNATLTWFETAHYPKDGKWSTIIADTMASTVMLFELYDPKEECSCCMGDEALYWKDGCNNAFIDSTGEMLVTVNGEEITFHVGHCPKCGRAFVAADTQTKTKE